MHHFFKKMNYCLLLVASLIAGSTATIEYKDLIDTTNPETFLNLTYEDLNSTADFEDADIKEVIINELARNGQRLDSHVLNFLDNPISESGKFEGDIELPPNAQISSSNPNYWNEAYAAIINNRRLWPGGVVPYELSSHYGAYARAKFNQAFNDFKKYSCVKFVPHSGEVDYLIIRPKLGCGSQIGRMGGDQLVSLAAGCIEKTTIIHELMHAVGFYHEQVRYDRDNHITILWQNIRQYPNILEQFQKQNASVLTVLGKPYDQNSVMHYGAKDFARDPALITITAKDGGTLSNDNGFTHIDIEKLNELYNCYHSSTTTMNTTTRPSTTMPMLDNDLPTTTTTPKPTYGDPVFGIHEDQPFISARFTIDQQAHHLRSRNSSGFFVASDVSFGYGRHEKILYVDTDTFVQRNAYIVNGTNIATAVCGAKCFDVFHIIDYDVSDDNRVFLSLTWYPDSFSNGRYPSVLIKLDMAGTVESVLIDPCNFGHDNSSTLPNASRQKLAVLKNGQVAVTCISYSLFKVFSPLLEVVQVVEVESPNPLKSVSLSTRGSDLVLFDINSQTIFLYNTTNWEATKITIECLQCYDLHMRTDGIVIGVTVFHGVKVFLNNTVALTLNIDADYVVSQGDYIVAIVDFPPINGRSYRKSIRKYQLLRYDLIPDSQPTSSDMKRSSSGTTTSIPYTSHKLVNGTPSFIIDESQPSYSNSFTITGMDRANHLKSRNASGFFVATARTFSNDRRQITSLLYVDSETFELHLACTLDTPNITTTICGSAKCSDSFQIIDYDVGDDNRVYLSLIWYTSLFDYPQSVLVKLDMSGNVERYLTDPCNSNKHKTKPRGQFISVLDNGQIALSCNPYSFFKLFSSSLEVVKDIAIQSPNPPEIVSMSTRGNDLVLFDRAGQAIFLYDIASWEVQKYPIECNHCFDLHMRDDGVVIAVDVFDGVKVFVNNMVVLELNIKAEYVISQGDNIIAIVDVPRTSPKLFRRIVRKYELMRNELGSSLPTDSNNIRLGASTSIPNPTTSPKPPMGASNFAVDENDPNYNQSFIINSQAQHLRSRNASGFFVATDGAFGYSGNDTILYVDTATFASSVAYTLNGLKISTAICGSICYDVFHLIDYDVGDDDRAYISLTWYTDSLMRYPTVLAKIDGSGTVENFVVDPCNFVNDASWTLPKASRQKLTVLKSGQLVLTCNPYSIVKVFSSSLVYEKDLGMKSFLSDFASLSILGNDLVMFDGKSRIIFKYNTVSWELKRIPIDCIHCHDVSMRGDGIITAVDVFDGIVVFVDSVVALIINIKASYVISQGDFIIAIVDDPSTDSRLFRKSVRKYRLLE